MKWNESEWESKRKRVNERMRMREYLFGWTYAMFRNQIFSTEPYFLKIRFNCFFLQVRGRLPMKRVRWRCSNISSADNYKYLIPFIQHIFFLFGFDSDSLKLVQLILDTHRNNVSKVKYPFFRLILGRVRFISFISFIFFAFTLCFCSWGVLWLVQILIHYITLRNKSLHFNEMINITK